jgi:hypothetical protein
MRLVSAQRYSIAMSRCTSPLMYTSESVGVAGDKAT